MCAYVCRTQREDVFVRVAEWTFVVFSHLGSLFFSCVALLVCSPIEPLRLQLESQSDFVSTTVHVLPVNQTWEGELHSCRDTCWIMYHQQCSRSLDCCYIKQCEKKKPDNQLTWPEGLCVSNSNEAGVVNFGLWGEIKKKLHEHVRSPAFAGWNLLHPFPFLHIEICKHRAQVEKYQNPLLTNTSVHHKIPAKLMTLPPASALLCVTMLISKCWHA